MLTILQRLGCAGLMWLRQVGCAGCLLGGIIGQKPKFRQLLSLCIIEIYKLGVLSLLVIVLAGLFIGFVVSLQGYHTLEKFGATTQLSSLLALSVVRELGPVLSALLFVGRAGSALTAEIGLMNTTAQIASMDMMGVNPISRIIAPRFWAGVISLPLLTILFNVTAIGGGYGVAVHWLGSDPGIFWNNMQAAVDFWVDIMSGLWKSIIFAIVVTWIAVYQGFYSIKTAEGVALATTRSVVYASLAILALDFILTAVMIEGW